VKNMNLNFKLPNYYSADYNLLHRDWLCVKMCDRSGWTFISTKTGVICQERFKSVCDVNDADFEYNMNSQHLGYAVVEMLDESGWTLFNPETKQLIDQRFKSIESAETGDSLFVVEMCDGSGYAYFDIKSKKSVTRDLKNIFLARAVLLIMNTQTKTCLKQQNKNHITSL